MHTYDTIKPLDLSPETTPILFNTNKHSQLTDQYQLVRTIDPVNVLRDHGWQPRQLITLKTRKESRKGLQAHRVRLFNPSLPMVNNSFLELLLTNAYDGSKAFQIELGVFRIVCSNGLVVGDTYSRESVKHIGYASEKIAQALTNVLPQAETISHALDQWSDITLTQDEQRAFAQSALELRLDSDGKYILNDQRTINNVLCANRRDDRDPTLWNTFNVVQENMLKLGFRAANSEKRKRTKVRAIKSMDQSDKLNRALWSLTEKMAELKAA